MVKKNPEAPAAPASSDSDSDSSSSSEGEAKKTAPVALNKPAPADDKEATDSEDGDTSKPISQKPNSNPTTPSTPKASVKRAPSVEVQKKPAQREANSDTRKPITKKKKRAPSVEDHKDSKKPKTEKLADEEQGKKSTLIERVWSEDDEIVLLEGMLEYKEKKGVNPVTDTKVFYDFIKLRISFDRNQVVNKSRRLKKRYENSAGRKNFSAHETIVLQLSKKIWGGKMATYASSSRRLCGEIAGNATGKEHEQEEEDASVKFIGKLSISMGMGLLNENMLKVGLALCSKHEKAEIEEKWKELYLEESNFFLRKLDLVHQEQKMIIEALKSEEN